MIWKTPITTFIVIQMIFQLLFFPIAWADEAGAFQCELWAKREHSELTAIEKCTAQIDSDPNDIESVFWRGYAYAKRGKYDNQSNHLAIEDFTRLLNVRPDDVQALENRAVVYNRLRKYEEALVDSNRAIQLSPESLSAYMARGEANLFLKNNDGALNDLSKVIQMKPAKNTLLQALAFRINLYVRVFKRLDLALSDLNFIISSEPSWDGMYAKKGEVLGLMGRKQEAIAAYRSAINIIESDPQKSNKSYYLSDRDKYLKAIADLSK